MYINRDPALIACQIAEETRALIAATANPTYFGEFAAVHAVAEGLQLAVQQLPPRSGSSPRGSELLRRTPSMLGTPKVPMAPVSRSLRALLNAEQAKHLVARPTQPTV
ncbi:hypothetical protein [Streptomyces chattanoogensis]|uniref:hypothetical protein n=1 Tax=Streptomyces chattanoogensis TaxID=66876 RepID=UPI0036840849